MSDMSRFETMIGKPGDGSSPHAALVDEYHEHESDHMVDAMQTGMGAREQPLLSIITTAGSNLAGPCFEKRREIIQILENRQKAENVFGIIYTTDEDDDWDNPESLIKANPNYGVSVFPEFLKDQLEQAKRSAAKQNSFRTKHLNQWVGARTVWMNMLAWRRQQKSDFDPAKLREYPCWIAVDLASKRDVAAIVILWQKDDKYYSHYKFYAPESAVEENDKYLTFANEGDLILTPGNMTDYAFIEEEIIKLWKEYDVQDVAFDDWQANYLITRLQEKNIEVINYNQTVKNMSEPMKEVEALVIDGRLFHDGNKCMNWMMGNVTARIDAKDNIYPRKENEKDKNCKIDGPVALIMAMGRAKQGGGVNQNDYTIAFV
jgi:phage terminase large subunit-like protein